MSGAEIILHLAGAVALLLWSTRLVRTGIERVYGPRLGLMLGRAFRNRLTGALSGAGLAIAMQSATAVIVMVSAFVAAGHLSTIAAIGAVVGADLGSALVVKLLRVDLSILVPILLLSGMLAFRLSEARKPRQWGRILFGLGLVLLSLKLIGTASVPLRESHGLPSVLGYFESDWVSMVFVVAAMTWLFHSSVAAVLLFALLADQGVVVPALALPIVLGINLGGAIIAIGLTRGQTPLGRLAPLANGLLRGGLALVTLAATPFLPLSAQGGGDGLVNLHIGFNIVVLALGLALAGPLARLLPRLIEPRAAVASGPVARRSALIERDLDRPAIAVQNVARELVQMGERVETMIARVPGLFREPSTEECATIYGLDDEIDQTHSQIKLYIARIAAEAADDATRDRLGHLLGAAIRLEQIGDVIVHKLVARAQKKQNRGVDFSKEGWQELTLLHAEVMQSARLAMNVLVSGDIAMARELAEQKEIVRDMERRSALSHIDRLRSGITASFETSDVHIDAIYDLKEINSLLVTLAYPILDAAGLLRANRLRKPRDASAPLGG